MNRFAAIPMGAVLACLLAVAAPAVLAQQAQPKVSQEERIQRLEEHLLDLNSMIGTLQSMVNQNGAAAQPGAAQGMTPPQPSPSGALPADTEQRLNAIETQISALSGQIEQMGQQIAQLQAALGGGQLPRQGGPPSGELTRPPRQQGGQQQGQTFGQTTIQPGAAGQQALQAAPGGNGQSQPYGSGQPQNYEAASSNPWLRDNAPSQPAPQRQTSLAPSSSSRADYDAAYNHLLQRDFDSAEEGFRDFLQAHPDDPLAGNAQYWLGEVYYVRGEFRKAADSFLAGYRKYRSGDKAPANLLKLGMSLNQLGEKDAACSTFSELANKFPNAPSHLKQRAASERERSGC